MAFTYEYKVEATREGTCVWYVPMVRQVNTDSRLSGRIAYWTKLGDGGHFLTEAGAWDAIKEAVATARAVTRATETVEAHVPVHRTFEEICDMLDKEASDA